MRLTSPRGLARRGAFAFSRARVSRLFWGAASIVGALWAVSCGGTSDTNFIAPPVSPLAVEGDGSAENPILLGNIYQLQFIGGALPSEAAERITEDFRFNGDAAQSVAMSVFGFEPQRVTMHYKLTADLDLSAAAGWDGGKGFDPIGSESAPFSGIFNGDGYVLRGLRIRRGGDDPVGFFAYLGDGARVVSLGIADARVEGRMTVGALAGDVAENARLEDVWAWGRVFGATSVTVDSILETTMAVGFGGMVGGLVGHLAGGIERGWFGGHARAENGDSAGGLVGFAEISGRIEDSWAMAAVRGESMVGGLLGGAIEGLTVTVIDSSWAAGPVFSTVSMYGGLAGLSTDYSENSFSGIETSGRSQAGGGGIAVNSILTLIANWDADVWSFGGTLDFPILRAVDFPVLRTGDSDLQETAMAYGLTRLSAGSGDLWSVFPIGVTMTIGNDNEAILALDVNGLAANPGDAGEATSKTPTPDCRFFNDRMEAVTNYNGAKVRMWMVADNAVLRAYSGGDECYARVIGSGEGILRVDFAVGSQRMTLDYPFEIASGGVNPPFGVSFPSGISSFVVMENTEVEISLSGLDATFAPVSVDIIHGFSVRVAAAGGTVFVTPTLALTAIFDADEREVTLTLTAMDAVSEQSTTLRAILVSPPRPFDGGNSEVRVTSPVAGTVVLSATDDVRISLWHLFGRSTMFSLAYNANAGDLLFGVDSESGQVSLARPPRDDENNLAYSLTLRGRPNDNGVLGDQVGEQTIRVLLGNPLLEVIGDGSEESPYIIDDIYELQAIDGVLPDEAVTEVASRLSMTTPKVRRLTTNLFSRAPRSGANYRLGADIDATPTRGWGVLGFKPIDNFTGVLDGCVTSACDGGVYVVRGLYINRTGGNNIGLFSQITKSGELAVHDLGVEEANINGGGNVGIIAGKTENVEFRKVWTSGRVDGEGNNVGGLIGSLEGGGRSTVRMSWSTADVKGDGNVGGISGNAFANNDPIGFSDNWAAGEVIGASNAGGFSGFAENINYFRNWSSGAISGSDGGFLGQEGSEPNNFRDLSNYWDLNTSGVTTSAGGDGVTLQTLTSTNSNFGDGAAAWHFGGNNDFPLLSVFSRPLQAVYLTRALTRILPLNGTLEHNALFAGSEQPVGLEADGFRLDTNGLAANGGASCRLSGGVLRAQTNYNDTVVEMRLLTGGGERLAHVAGSCDTRIEGITDVFTATLRLEISAPASGDNEARRLTVDYTADIAPSLEFDDFLNPATVAANATMNAPVLTISARQSRVLFTSLPTDYFAADIVNNKVTINITKPATEVFDGDGKRAAIIVTAMGVGATNTLTAVFVSAPRAISSADRFIDINIVNVSVGAIILASIDSGLTIWHNDNDDEFYTINSAGNFLTVGRTSGDVTAVRNLQIGVDYVATLSLTDGASGVAAMRVLTVSVSEGLAIRTPRQPVVVAVGATEGATVYTALLSGGDEDDRSFDAVSTGDFQTDGGEDAAEITITRTAADVFATDGAMGEIVLTASDSTITVTATIRFVSAPLVFPASPVPLFERNLIRSAALANELFLATNSLLSIWHSDNSAERYELSGTAANSFTVDEITGEVRIARNLSAGEYSFTLNLVAADKSARARRELRLVVTEALAIIAQTDRPVTVAADAAQNSVVYTASLTGGMVASSFDPVTDGDLRVNSGGSVSLDRAAMEAFASDNLTLSLTLTAIAGGETATATIRFVSAPLAIDNDTLLSMTLSSTAAGGGVVILAGGESRLSIWHFDGTETYELVGANANAFAVSPDTGEVRIATGLDAMDNPYRFELQLRGGGVTATLAIRVDVGTPGPLVIVAVSDPVAVAAAATINTKVLTVLLSGGENSSFASAADVNFQTGGGERATVSLARAATAAFNADNAMLDFVLTANADGGESATLTVRFASAPRARSKEDAFNKDLSFSAAIAGAEILALVDSELSIWHFADADESYALATGADSAAFELSGDNIVVADAQLDSIRTYIFTLQLSGGESGDEVIATREIRVRVGASPLMIDAASDPVVAAAATLNAEVLTVTLRGGENSSFAAAANDNFKTGGGAQAVVSLARAATAAFNADNATLDFVLTANADDGESATLTVQFVSAPRAISQGALEINLELSAAGAGDVVLAGGASKLSIWHFDDTNDSYGLDGVNAGLFDVVTDTGEVSIGGSPLVENESYDFQLQLTNGGVVAMRDIRVSVLTELDPADAERQARQALDDFVAEIAEGDFDWFSNDDSKKVGGTSLDWDNDGINNPYDWTPTSVTADDGRMVAVNLTLSLTGPGGTADNPWPIYNVWQLQAIEGVSVSHDGTQSGNLTLFGGGNARVAAQYRLATNIDATPTKQWKTTGGITLGFDPIGGTFSGFFDGGGYAVRGLFIDRRGAPTAGERDRVGLFRDINKSGELAVINLGVEDADIRGRTDVGIIAGRANASFSKVWTTGEVVGADEVAAVGGAGGLIANFGARDAVNTIMMSWSAANINANGGQQVGGLVGVNAQTGDNTIDNNWAAGNVRGNRAVAGGFSGNAANATLNGNWSSGAVSGNSDVGGFIGSASRASIVSGYWNRDTSDQATSAGGVAAVVQTLAAVNFGGDDATLTWAFGEDDFPLLTVLSRPWQAVNLARSLTRIFGVGDAEATEAATGITFTTNGVRLDTNGLAPDTESGGTSIPTCAVVGGELLAQTNYNDITTKLILITDGTQALVSVAATDTHCEVGFANAEDEFAATLRVEISAPAIGDDPAHTARSLTTDYALRIAPERLAAAREIFVAEIAAGDFNWFSTSGIVAGTSSLDWDNDGIANPYDWTPTSVNVNGRTVGVDLTSRFTGEGGTAENPWPIYNVWQLQAIDGVSVSHTGATGSSDIFGGGRLTAQYRLALDIDATPTKQWDSEAGFDPIGDSFSGFLDGGGYAVRGLVINRGGDANVGLFANIAKSDGGLAVRNMGVEDANIRGAGAVGILAGFVTDASFSEVWTTGEVRGAGEVGGLIGSYAKARSNNSAIRMSWSAADVVSSANAFGGLIGFQQGSGGSFNIDDNWAAGDVRGVGSAGSAGGFSGFPFVGDYARNWSSGAISSSGDFVGGFSGNVISGGAEYIYWNEDTSGLTASTASGEAAVVQTLVASNFGGGASSAWAGLDDNADFPLLTVHSRPWQAVNLARALTRVLLVNDGGGSDAEGIDLATANEIRLDTNGLAPDTGSDGTSIPTCEFVNGELRAQTNYNGVMVKLTMMTGGDEAFAARSGCEVGFQNVTGEFAATLRLEISAPAIGDDLARSLTTDYALRITMDSDTAARDEFVRMIEAGGFDWFAAGLAVAGGNPGDWDNDGNQNRYDWTPTSISVGGVLTQVDLLLGEERNRGTATNPWPIYNVWQLQAIDGIRVDAGVPTGDFNLFGSTVARLGSHYRLAVDIDATPTRDWQTIGFNPIGVEDNNITTNFIGAFDGEGREIRGLFMNSSDANAALFDHVGTGGRVSRVGLRDVDVRVRDGGNRAAGAVARLDGGTVSLVWASGTVQGALFNNAGLVGYLESGELRESWFVGDIEGNGGNGGLVGLMATGEIADSWAMAEVRQIGDNQPNGGLIGRANGGALTTSWSGGPVADGDNSGGIIGKPTTDDSVLAGGAIYLDTLTSGESDPDANTVAADIITVRTMATVRSGFDEAVWNYGVESATDYPFLRGIESFRPGLQAALFADFQTQILPRIGEATLSVGGRTAMRQDESVNLILDTNGKAVGAPTPIPSCEAGATTAKTNYNNVTVQLRATDAGSVVFTDNCEIAFRFADSIGGATEFSAEVLIVSGEITILNWTHSFDLEAALDSSAMEAMTIFTAEIARDDFNWFSNALIVGSGSSLDWDNDGIANPYDWTPTSVAIGDGRSIGVNLTLEGAPDGSATMPWPIYNVWQLQAIDGVSVSDAGATVGGFTLFAATEAARLSMQYALALDIDATPTRGWGTVGFNPIGGSFSGFLDGGGYAVRGLFINLTVGDVGLFGIIDRGDGELAVRNMGVEDADIRGQSRIGILAGQVVDASFSRVWTTGKAFASNGAVGGLIGAYNKNSDNSGAVMMSWSSANVEAAADFAGGLIGLHRRTGGSSTALVFNDNWAAGDVTAARSLGGFSGSALIGSYARNWSSGVVSGASGMGGFSGTSIVGEHAYWNKDTSGIDDASTNSEGVVVQSLTEFDFGGDIESAAWDFGDNDISNGDADFPLLDNLSQPWQAVNLARALTRLLGVGEAAAITVATGVTLTTNGIRLDTNGLAADMGSRGTSTPTCAFVSASGVFRAQTNYNGVTVDLSLLAGGGEAFAEISAENTANCEIGFANATGEFAATLRVEISAPVIDGDPARGLTTDYALRIKPNIPAAARAAFVREIARDDFDWYSNALIVGGGSTLDWDNDGVLNPYDWTPTSVAIIDGGDLFEVNLTLGGANGSARLPWPIYNIWQLQAIDGISISETGKRSDTFAFFGANAAAALTAQYRLELNIDASPTENWDAISGLSTFGFDPIGGNFTGYMDGQGFAVRGLFIDRGSDNIGLFSRISKTGEMAVWNMGVEDADIRGGNRSGILVGENDANLGRIWTTGSVRGGVGVGGVAGQLIGQSNTIMMSWSTADVDGAELAGGFAGFNNPAETTDRVFYNDNWAGGNVNSADAAAGGFVSNPYRSNFTRNWSAGEVLGGSGGGFAGINTAPVSYASVYWNTDTSGRSSGGVDSDGPDVVGAFVQTLAISNFGDSTAAAAWYFGDSDFSDSAADFPLLTAHDLPWQAVNLARALTRVLGVDGAKTVTAAAGMDFVADTIRLDTNAQAPNTRAGGTSAPSCDLDIVNGVLRAQTNYNGITINLSLLTDGNGSFRFGEWLRHRHRKPDRRVCGDFAFGDFRARERRRFGAQFDDGLRFAHCVGGGGAGGAGGVCGAD